MKNPWELKADDSRIEDSLYTFVIFCEDEVSEYVYFKWFETQKIKINIINKQRSMMSNVLNAITYCKENQILIKEGEKFSLNTDSIEVWCVYDRDFEDDNGLISKGNTEFDESITTANSKGIKVAWSIDAFELWILLHFIEIDPNNADTHNREYYYDQLTNIFKGLKNPNDDLKKALVHESFGYKKDLKQKNNFTDIVKPEILHKTNLAIERAKALVEFHKKHDNHYDKKPCTLVFQLVEILLNKGGKEIPKKP